jgi:hypothetical protein
MLLYRREPENQFRSAHCSARNNLRRNGTNIRSIFGVIQRLIAHRFQGRFRSRQRDQRRSQGNAPAQIYFRRCEDVPCSFRGHSDSIADRFSAVSIATAGAIDEYCYSRSRGTSRCARYVLRCYGCYDRPADRRSCSRIDGGDRVNHCPIGCRRVSQQSVELLSARSRPFPKGADIIRLFN